MPRGLDTSGDPNRRVDADAIRYRVEAQRAAVQAQAGEYNRLRAKWHSGENLTAEEGSSPMGQQLRRDIYGSD